MKIGILSRSPKIYSTARLVKEAEERGHEVTVVNPLKCYMNITGNHPDVYYKHKKVQEKLEFDAIVPRIGASATIYGAAVLRQFEVAGVYTVNGSVAITRSRDKLRSHQLLARKEVGIPITSYAHSGNVTRDLISSVGGAPLIVKVIESTQGKGVLLAETTKAAESLINAFLSLHADFLVQEFIKESSGADIRCFVIGDKVVAAMKRQGVEGEFKSNLHNGGSAEMVKISPTERAVAVKAAKVLGLKVSGVDIVRSNRGPLVLEVNSSPGLEGIEKTTGKNVAANIIEFIEKDINRTTRTQIFMKG
ncbi:MAG: 30S ribosomal protein S6--L-glutamate ligase [Rickettsiaceae bacterium]|nr:30S ribosomal protein S6--L-glutamate ligase [Rickettsiaceae bacterium]